MTITTSAQALSVEEAYDILRRSYVDRLPRAAKDAESLDELFSYTDNYTCYMTEEEYQTFLSSVEGEVSFAGIGAEITYAPDGISIVSVSMCARRCHICARRPENKSPSACRSCRSRCSPRRP